MNRSDPSGLRSTTDAENIYIRETRDQISYLRSIGKNDTALQMGTNLNLLMQQIAGMQPSGGGNFVGGGGGASVAVSPQTSGSGGGSGGGKSYLFAMYISPVQAKTMCVKINCRDVMVYGAMAALAAGTDGAALPAEEAALEAGLIEVNGFKFPISYYEKLWNTGRLAPGFRVESIIKGATESLPDTNPSFVKYIHNGWELIMDPITNFIQHLQPL